MLECLKSHHPYQTPELLVLPLHTETQITSHGSTHLYADPALCSTSVFAGLFDAPGRSQFAPRIKPLLLIFSKTNMTLI